MRELLLRGKRVRMVNTRGQASVPADRANRLRVAIGRGSDFFGPGVMSAAIGERAIYPALAGKAAQMIGNLDVPHSFTYIDDFGKALVTLGERDEALGQAWHVPNHQPALTQRQMMTLFFEAIGTPPKMVSMGRTMMGILGVVIPAVREMKEMMYALEKPYFVDSAKFERAFGINATPIHTAVQRTLEWFRAHPRRA